MSWIIYNQNTLVLKSKHENEPSVSTGELKADVGSHYFLPGQSLQNFKYEGGSIVEREEEDLVKENIEDEYVDVYKGRIYVRRNRWYGLNISYGEGYYNANYNYGSGSYTNLPTLQYYKGVGSIPNKNGKLKRICISFARSSSNIDNLQLYVNKMSKTSGSSSVVNKTLLHQDEQSEGVNIQSGRPYFFEIEIDEEVTTNDVIMILFNSSSNSNGTRYLYATEIKYIYE